MSRYPCPICGDPNGFPIWIDETPPAGCPQDEAWHHGARTINSVTECAYQMGKAKQRAQWREVAPDAFDAAGNLIPGQLARVLLAWSKSYPDVPVIL